MHEKPQMCHAGEGRHPGNGDSKRFSEPSGKVKMYNKFEKYLDLIQKWNQTYNLTAITNRNEMMTKHIADSLSINEFLHGENIIDVGTGAGLPGIPLAIMNPSLHFTLLDSNSKKTRFLIQAIYELELTNISVVHERAENYKPEKCFTSVVSRAFSSLTDMVAMTHHLCCSNGELLAMKGGETEETSELPHGYQIKKIHKISDPNLKEARHLVILSHPGD